VQLLLLTVTPQEHGKAFSGFLAQGWGSLPSTEESQWGEGWLLGCVCTRVYGCWSWATRRINAVGMGHVEPVTFTASKANPPRRRVGWPLLQVAQQQLRVGASHRCQQESKKAAWVLALPVQARSARR
jgi:hypothetical protein